MSSERPGLKSNLLVAVMLLLAHIGTLAQTTPPTPRLTGIVHLGDAKLAVLEVPRTGLQTRGDCFILAERQSEGRILVMEIVPQKGTVKVKLFPGGDVTVLALTNNASGASTNRTGMVFENASLESVLNLYSEFSRRTLLCSPRLPRLSLSLVAPAENRAAAVSVIQRALNEKGVATIPDGEKFMMIVPQEQVASLKPRSSEIKAPDAAESKMFPPGTINFLDTDISQVLQIYATFCGYKLDQSAPMPPAAGGTIRFCNQTPLSGAEVVYALDTLLGWAGLKMVPGSGNQMKPVPIQEANP